MVKNPAAMQETQVRSLGQEDPLKKGMTTHSSVLAWRIPMERAAWQSKYTFKHVYLYMVLPRWLSGKETACNAAAAGDMGPIPR